MSTQTKKINVIPYNPAWPKLFEEEASKIKEALGDNGIAIYHIGSTAVPGLSAKPKIDILAVVKDPQKATKNLEAIGLKYAGEWSIPLQYGFKKRGDVNVNLHVYEEGHPDIELNLLFRNYLREHPKDREKYTHLKENLLKDESSLNKRNFDFAEYTIRKNAFISKILEKASFNKVRMMICLHDAEWEAAKKFRQKYYHPLSDPYTWTFNHPDHTHLVLYKGTKIVGYAHLQRWPKDRVVLRILVIDKPFRHQGLGGQFLALIEKWLKAHGTKSLHTESSSEMCSFYKENGYKEMPFNDPENYESHPQGIAMGKIL